MEKTAKIILATGLAAALSVGSFAAGSLITISVDPTVKIKVNGEEFKPKDANGNDVMTFIYNGTTYAPLRALAEAYGLQVGYDAGANMATVDDPDAGYVPVYDDFSEDYDFSVDGGLLYSDEGSGDSVVTGITVSSPSYFRFKTPDDGHHSVKAYYGTGDYEYDLLVNESGAPYDGNTYLEANRTYDFEIDCGGEWSIEIYSLATTYETSFSGSGDYVTGIFQPETQYYTITYNGTDHFHVKQHHSEDFSDYELLVNESGEPYSGTVRIADLGGKCFFEVVGTEGEWSITPAQ